MTVLAEVVDESIKGMESGLVSRAEQEKVRSSPAQKPRNGHELGRWSRLAVS